MASGPQLLTTEIAVGPLAAGASTTVNHGIFLVSGSIAPNIVMPDRLTGIGVASVTSTQITFTNFGTSSDSANFLVEFESTYQRDLSSTAVQYWQGGSSALPPSPTGTMTVYVNKGGNDTTGDGSFNRPFLTIGAAQTSIPVGVPSLASPWVLIIGPGTYNENVTLLPFVYLVGYTHNDFGAYATTINGSVTFIDTSASNNRCCIQNLAISTGPITVDFSGKGGGTNFLYIVTCNARVTTNLTGPNGFVVIVGGTFNGGAWATIGVRVFEGARHFTTTLAISGAPGSNNLIAQNGSSLGATTLTAGSAIQIDGGVLDGLLSVAAGCTADLTGAIYGSAASFAGPGAINRPRLNGSTGALAAGSQVVTFAIPLIDANYNVMLVETAGGGTLVPQVTAKAAGTFTVLVPAGGATYDYTVIHN